MGLASTIRQWQSSWARANEFAALEQDQREALARDTGLSDDVLENLMVQGPEAAAELPRLMRALGLTPERTERIHPTVMRDMSIVCSGCELKRRCRNDIDCGWAPVVQRYCPNTHTIKALHRERYELTLPRDCPSPSNEPCMAPVGSRDSQLAP